MNEYKEQQKAKHAKWKYEKEEQERMEREKKHEALVTSQINTFFNLQNTQITNDQLLWEKEGFEKDDAYCISLILWMVDFMVNQLQDKMIYLHSPSATPRLFGFWGQDVDGTHNIYFDIRHVFFSTNLCDGFFPCTSRKIQMSYKTKEWVECYWQIINPYRYIKYLTPSLTMQVECDDEVSNVDHYVSSLDGSTASESVMVPFARDDQYGAFSVSLPFPVMFPFFHNLEENKVTSNSFDNIFVVELSVNTKQSQKLPVYAYCRNPDDASSGNSKVKLSWRLKNISHQFDLFSS